MHSSRMRTARLLPVSPSMHCSPGRWGVPDQGGVPALGVYLPRSGVYLHWGGYLPRRCVPAWGSTCAGILPPCGQTDACKNITFANFVWRQ